MPSATVASTPTLSLLEDEKKPSAADSYPSPDGSNQSFDYARFQPENGGTHAHLQHQHYEPQRPSHSKSRQNRAPVPIPAQQPQVQPRSFSEQQTQPGPMGAAGPSGPMSSTVSIPARPKPGRKPIQHENKEDKNCKRRAQNRDSQRRFRDKRQIKLADATEELGSVKEHMKDLECNYERRLENERMQRQKLEREVKYLKEQILKVTNDKSHFHSLSLPTETRSHSNLPAQPQNPTPTEEYASREIDFTSAFENLGRDPQQYTAAASTARGPGSCAACQADETGEMRRKCIELSQNTTYDTTMTDAPAERPAGLDSARGSFADGFGNKFAPMSSQTMSCSEFIHEYQQQAAGRFRPLNDVFGGRVIQGFQAPEGPIDLDHAEAAAVLSSMSRRNTVTQNE